MLRLFLLAVAVTTIKASHLSLSGVDGLHQQPKLISQSVGLHEVPTKIIKITKTVAIRVPVPYPVKVPHHIPVPVPVNHPVAIPVPQIVKVPHHVPIEVAKHIPVELHQQVPLVISRPVPIPQPVQVPHVVQLDRPVYYPVPHPIPYQNSGSEQHGSFYGQSADNHGSPTGYGTDGDDSTSHATRSYTYYTVDSPQGNVQSYDSPEAYKSQNDDFQPSQPDYNAHH